MNARPKCCDLYCGAGGSAMGLYRAGFDVTGFDIAFQKHYPFDFIQANALEVDLSGFDFVWASPPCQRYSEMTRCRGTQANHPDLISATRDKILQSGLPFIIENVNGARMELRNPLTLCGAMFGLKSYRHRRFECSVFIMEPHHPAHAVPCARAGHWEPGKYASVTGNCSPVKLSKEALGIDWMNRDELSQAIPPAYSEFLGKQILKHL